MDPNLYISEQHLRLNSCKMKQRWGCVGVVYKKYIYISRTSTLWKFMTYSYSMTVKEKIWVEFPWLTVHYGNSVLKYIHLYVEHLEFKSSLGTGYLTKYLSMLLTDWYFSLTVRSYHRTSVRVLLCQCKAGITCQIGPKTQLIQLITQFKFQNDYRQHSMNWIFKSNKIEIFTF